jgi:transcription antitermination factor NusG
MSEKWFAVYTKPKWEKKVAKLLTSRQIENYCPLNLVVRQWSDRKKRVYEPLFSSYVFVHVCEKQLTALRQVPGIINLVTWLNKPAEIKEQEIQAIREFLDEYKSVKLEKAVVNLNDTVRILSGPLTDYKGDVIEIRNNTIKVILPSLGYQMTAEIQRSNIEVISDRSQSYSNLSYQIA